MRKNTSYKALLSPTRLLISEKSASYTIKWSYTIIWQVRVKELLEKEKKKYQKFSNQSSWRRPINLTKSHQINHKC
jgi:hypothetical protein